MAILPIKAPLSDRQCKLPFLLSFSFVLYNGHKTLKKGEEKTTQTRYIMVSVKRSAALAMMRAAAVLEFPVLSEQLGGFRWYLVALHHGGPRPLCCCP